MAGRKAPRTTSDDFVDIYSFHFSHLRYGMPSICYASFSMSMLGIVPTFSATTSYFDRSHCNATISQQTPLMKITEPKKDKSIDLQSSSLQRRLNKLDALLHTRFNSDGSPLYNWRHSCKSTVPSWTPFRCLCCQSLFGAGDEEEERWCGSYAGGSDDDACRAGEGARLGYHDCGCVGRLCVWRSSKDRRVGLLIDSADVSIVRRERGSCWWMKVQRGRRSTRG